MGVDRTWGADVAYGHRPAAGEREPVDGDSRGASPPLSVRVWYPSSDTAVVALSGMWTDTSMPRVRELLEQRLRAMMIRLIVDLSGLRFVSAHAARLLGRIEHRAVTSGKAFAVVTGAVPAVEGALRSTEGTSHISRYPTLDAAMRKAAGPDSGLRT